MSIKPASERSSRSRDKPGHRSTIVGSFDATPELQRMLEDYQAALADGKSVSRDGILAAFPEQASRLAEPCRLVGEDRRRPRWKRADQRAGGKETLADPLGHDLDQDLAGTNQFLHVLTIAGWLAAGCRAPFVMSVRVQNLSRSFWSVNK